MIKQGDLYWYDFGAPVDERQAGNRPALIIQTDFLNDIASYGLTIVLPITTKGRSSHIKIEPSTLNCLPVTSYVKFEQIYTVTKRNLGNPIGRLDAEDLKRVKAMLREVFSLGS